MPSTVPKVKLNNNLEIPIVGLGTWKSKPELTKQSVKDAVYASYRHIDCAYLYMNEKEVGEAIHELFTEGVIKREELFVTSKLWNTFHSKDKVRVGINESLKLLGLAYLDLYLIHWPVGYQEGGENIPKNENGDLLFSDIDFVETWKAMEGLVREGLCRSIGVSNFNAKQIQRIIDEGEIKPAILQIENNPYLTQQELVDFAQSNGIAVTAYSPFGSPDRAWATGEEPKVLEDPVLKSIADKHGKTPAQVALRFQIQRNVIVIPKSVTASRIKENLQIFDFTLSDEEMKTIANLNRDLRAIAVPWMKGSPYFPF